MWIRTAREPRGSHNQSPLSCLWHGARRVSAQFRPPCSIAFAQ